MDDDNDGGFPDPVGSNRRSNAINYNRPDKKMTLTDGVLQFFKKDVALEEEKKEGESGEERKAEEDVKEDEEEKQIQAEEDYKVRCRKYLFYLQKVKGAGEDGELSNDDSYKVEGMMYTETSLFRIIKALDQIISLSMER